MFEYLIWSEEHGAWWRPNHAGYTTSMKRAGRYPTPVAQAICVNANAGGTFCEVMVEITPVMDAMCSLMSGGR